MISNEPVARRLQFLFCEYTFFSQDKNARILCWRLQPDEVRMAETFLATEQDKPVGQSRDIFLQLQTPFEKSSVYGYSLRQELIAWYEAKKENLTELGSGSDWVFPQISDSKKNINVLMDTVFSLLRHYAIQGQLVMVLRPKRIDLVESFQRWLNSFSLEASEQVRILLFDDAVKPRFELLASENEQRVQVQELKLDIFAESEELSIAAGNLDKPGGRFRYLFVKLTSALKAQDLTTALALGDKAVKLVAEQRWYYLVVPVHMMLAGSLSSADRHKEAVTHYKAAEAAAAQGETEGLEEETKASCPQLRLQARMGCGTALMTARHWKLAAQQFTETAPLAAEQGEARAELDCHRLASFCYEQAGNWDGAFRAGGLGFQVAREMDQETLETSSFTYLGEAMMRLSQNGTSRDLPAHTEKRIIEIAGTRDWRPKQAQENI
ncbi:MAG: hypothetical protein D3917_10370 [Candidatus Electrothrix sp. AX5]|nr:hypothetical protein [Candidatus Electrothrix sp. AX5]